MGDCRGLLWWCAFDQTRLTSAPYEAMAVERELGLLDEDHEPKPMLTELTRFAALLPPLPANLPERRIDAVCILTQGQDAWAAAYSAWVLATQAKLSLRFAWAEAPLPDAELYFLPSLTGVRPITRRRWVALLAKVDAGASLRGTLGDGIVEPFSDVFGAHVRSRAQRTTATTFTLPTGERLTAHHGPDLRLAVEPGTEVLASADDGTPMVTRRAYGKGQVTLTSRAGGDATHRNPRRFPLPGRRALACALPPAHCFGPPTDRQRHPRAGHHPARRSLRRADQPWQHPSRRQIRAGDHPRPLAARLLDHRRAQRSNRRVQADGAVTARTVLMRQSLRRQRSERSISARVACSVAGWAQTSGRSHRSHSATRCTRFRCVRQAHRPGRE